MGEYTDTMTQCRGDYTGDCEKNGRELGKLSKVSRREKRFRDGAGCKMVKAGKNLKLSTDVGQHGSSCDLTAGSEGVREEGSGGSLEKLVINRRTAVTG